ncbi:hypothetical protein D3C77_779740 [compost metagenome]
MFTVIRTHKKTYVGKFRLDQINDPVGDFLLMRAHGDNLGFADARSFEHVFARAVAEIDAETEFSGCTHAVR